MTAAANDTHGAPLRMLVIVGSLREASLNRRLAQLAISRSGDDIDAALATGLKQVEPFDGDDEDAGYPPGVAAMAQQIRASDAVLFVTPEYNGSIPGQLKNMLDWMSRVDGGPALGTLRESPMYGMPTAVVSASDGQFGAAWARDELLKVLRTQGARAAAEPIIALPSAHEAFDERGVLHSDETLGRLDQILSQLAASAHALRAARSRATIPS